MARLRPLQFGLKSLLLLTLVIAAFFGGKAWTDGNLFARIAAERAARENADTQAKAEHRTRLRAQEELVTLAQGLFRCMTRHRHADHETRLVLKPLIDDFNVVAELDSRSGSLYLLWMICDLIRKHDLVFVDMEFEHYDDLATWFDHLHEAGKGSMSRADLDEPPSGPGEVMSFLLRPTTPQETPLILTPHPGSTPFLGALQQLRPIPADATFETPRGRWLTHAVLVPPPSQQVAYPVFRVQFVWQPPIMK